MAVAILSVGISFIFTDAKAANPVLPGSANAGRVDKDHKAVVPDQVPEGGEQPKVLLPASTVPEGADKVKFVLKTVTVEGVTAFSHQEIESLYKKFLGKEIALANVWQIADLITQHYQENGYFISRAYVPEQNIANGAITIRAGEGHIGAVELKDSIADNYIVKNLIQKIKEEKPSRSQTVESFLLRLNDLPGVSFRSVIEPLSDNPENQSAVKLILVKEKKPDSGAVSFDNYNSRYLGPNEGTVSYSRSIIPFELTSISFLGGIPLEKLKNLSGSHEIHLSSEVSMQIYGGYTAANPGFTLSPKDIDSSASNLGVSLKDQFIRQRQENLSLTISFDGKNNYSDVLEAPLTRDRVRAARVNLSYDRDDPLDGYDFLNVTLSHGLEVFNASTKGQAFLSRAKANPDFNKFEYGLTRFQTLPANLTAVIGVSGQIASGVLYSSEQFGFGGQSYGRAYDPSEIIGDSGIAGSAELRYSGIPVFYDISIAPYAFYDVGKVWDDGQPSQSGSSLGFGIRWDSSFGISGNLTIAEPLTRAVEDPVTGNGKSPRYLFQMSYKF